MNTSQKWTFSPEHIQFLQEHYVKPYATAGRTARGELRIDAELKLIEKFPELAGLPTETRIRLTDVSSQLVAICGWG